MNSSLPRENDDFSDAEEVNSELTDAQRGELDRRVAKYKQDPSNVIEWEQVKAGLIRKL